MSIARRSLALGLVWLALAGTARAQPADRLGDAEVLRGRFAQERHLAGFERPLRSGGDFLIAGGRGLIWRTTEPIRSTVTIGPAAIVQATDGAPPLRLPVGGSSLIDALQLLLRGTLAGDWRGLDRDFEVERSGDAGAWQAVLVPRAAALKRDIASIAVRGGRFVEQVVLRKAGEDRDEIRFFDQELSRRPPDAADAALLDSAAR